ncbi:hypothetical protein K523DRAFT_118813 [Schizophyllum commune Tattone D]|nr:hypothetical protein K523DRAFT_118813 [Schizophyllum commune Tattone D]
MSSALLQRVRAPPALRVAQTSVRHYARAETNTGDPKKEHIRRALYPSTIRNKPTPTGTYRPDVARALLRAVPHTHAHEVIERAWLLHKRHVRKARDAELARKFRCMQEAMDELERIAPHLHLEANKREDPRARSKAEMERLKELSTPQARALDARIRGLFPRELKVPTETPSRTGWNYEWEPFQRPT